MCRSPKREQNANPSKTLLLRNEPKFHLEGGADEAQPQIYGDSESGSAKFPDLKLATGLTEKDVKWNLKTIEKQEKQLYLWHTAFDYSKSGTLSKQNKTWQFGAPPPPNPF